MTESGDTSVSVNELKRSLWFWFGMVTLILNMIGAISTLDVLSGVVLWVAQHWAALVDLPFEALGNLIGVELPEWVGRSTVMALAIMSMLMAVPRLMSYKVKGSGENKPDARLAYRSYSRAYIPFIATLLFIMTLMVTADLVRALATALLCAVLCVPPGFLVSYVYSGKRWEAALDRVEHILSPLARAMVRVCWIFWVGFGVLFLIGAWPWLLEQSAGILDWLINTVERRSRE